VVAPDCSHVISAGSDRKIRCWDLQTPQRSAILGGPSHSEEAYVYAAERVKGACLHPEHAPTQNTPPPPPTPHPHTHIHHVGTRSEIRRATGKGARVGGKLWRSARG
jgi:hypothetical protein